jgi:Mrp family chromosome partitioning ATPase/predicted Fe-Mo cluster-binding NifX family protein
MVLSGKGGVGKSTIAVFLATSLASSGKKVGLLDVDIHGPSVPKLLGLEDRRVEMRGDAVLPIEVSPNLRVMSIGFLLRGKRDAVIWRGPLKMGMIEEFLANVEWGDLDYLVIDSPPGTGDEPLSVCQLVPGLDGALIVATPQAIALVDVEKSITFCGKVRTRVLGVVENLSGFVCPHCGETVNVFKKGGAESLAREMGVPFLGSLPMDPEVVEACDRGDCDITRFESENLRKAFEGVASKVVSIVESMPASRDSGPRVEGVSRVALPLDRGLLSTHFGHSAEFAIYDLEDGKVVGEKTVEPPPHAPGVIPKWLQEQGVDLVIAGGLGSRAQALFEESGIATIHGAPRAKPRDVVDSYLAGSLSTGENICDH